MKEVQFNLLSYCFVLSAVDCREINEAVIGKILSAIEEPRKNVFSLAPNFWLWCLNVRLVSP